jgi:phosphohistidine phosphatase SixA
MINLSARSVAIGVVSSIVCLGLLAPASRAQMLSGNALAKALQQGGHVIVMRHAASPRQAPTTATANADNTTRERQLDETGRNTSSAMGEALRQLKIPIGDVLVSPTYRAMETAKYAQLANPKAVPELGDGGRSMAPVSGSTGNWLALQVKQFPAGKNSILITHSPNISRAFPDITGVADGEALIFGPDGTGGAKLVGRVKIEQWPTLVPKP